MRQSVLLLLALALGLTGLRAQTPTDFIFMEKRQICAALLYNHDAWDEYWEGTRLRTNGNIGTVSTQTVQAMIAGGLTKNLNLIVNLPYVRTKASQGTLAGQNGLQDLGLWAKWRPMTRKIGPGNFHVIAIGGLSTPVSDYNKDILPLSIGLGSQTASLRGMLNYHLAAGPFATLHWGHTWRRDIELERTFYWADGPHYTNKCIMPAVVDYGATVGYLKGRLKAELNYNQMITQAGPDIRRQDAPIASTRMIGGRASGTIQYYLPKPTGLSLIVMGGKTLSGRNVGKSRSIGGGVGWQFGLGGGASAPDAD